MFSPCSGPPRTGSRAGPTPCRRLARRCGRRSRATAPVKVDYDAYDDAAPELGDVIILQSPRLGRRLCSTPRQPGSPCPTPAKRYGGEYLVKRIVALPGDEIAFAADGRTIRNGERQAEAYIRRCRPRDLCALPRSIEVPERHYFVSGDNRRNSLDSRDFGPVPLEAVDGRVILEDETQ